MKHTRYLLMLPLLACTATDTWQSFAVDKRLTVELPVQATELNLAHVLPAGQVPTHTRTWVARGSEGLCVVMRMPFVNVEVIRQGDTTQHRLFYDSVAKRTLADENKPHLLKRTPFQVAGGIGIEIKYTELDARTGHRRVRYMRTLLLDSIGYNLIFRPANLSDSLGLIDHAQRRRFFNSITINP